MPGLTSYENQVGSPGINTAFGQNKYFKAVDEQINVLGLASLGQPYPRLWPKGSGVVDVYNKMNWKNSGSVDEVPQVMLIEKELKFGTWTTNLLSIFQQLENLGSKQTLDSYIQLYSAKETGFAYNFPYLRSTGESLQSIDNSWGPSDNIGNYIKSLAGTGGGGDIVGALAGAAVGAISPGVGFEDTMQFGKTTNQQVTITFPLYNTLSIEAAYDHFTFVNLFAFQNLKTRTSFMTYIPPKIYTVDAYSLGGLYMAAAYVSNFRVDSIGTTRRMTEFASYGASEVLMPEAYKISITLVDLVSPSSNIYAGLMGGNKISVTSGNEQIQEQAANIASGVVDSIKDSVKAGTAWLNKQPGGNNNPNGTGATP
jgi:hypothetical protein